MRDLLVSSNRIKEDVRKKILQFSISVAIALLLLYAICFIGAPISTSTSDWGAFGNYAAICLSLLSIALIYVTYREQRTTNEITRVEHHVVTMTNTLVSLSEKYHERLIVSYEKFSEHFKVPFYDISDCEYANTINVCTYYYSTITLDDHHKADFNYLFRYVQLSIDYILQEKFLSIGDKHLRVTELGCILPESTRMLFFCWLLINNKTKLGDYYKSGIFMLDETGPTLLRDIVTYVCTEELPQQKQIPHFNPDSIILEDYPDEQFPDTYIRLSKNKE